ncbi:MAG: SCO family protein [Gammaproteobacteria bacterium]|nr:SCO family protein [Gammaproteobacteria bacterium]MBL6999362.1 SCO family protein [Gammaproteobacteria bacterium]
MTRSQTIQQQSPIGRLLFMATTLFLSLSISGSGLAKDAGEIWGKDYFPNIELTNQDGEKVKFFDDVIKDKVVAINFIFTSCGDICPAETARLKEVADILGDRMGKDIFFYSITIDPSVDTPKVMKAYAKKYNTGPGWTFLTGDEEEIKTLRKKLGLYVFAEDESNRKLSDHNINLVIGNQAMGRWVKRSPMENPYVIANQMGTWLHNWKQVRVGNRNRYEDAPEIRQIGDGEMKFRTLCSSCHVINGGMEKGPNRHQVGPDLFAVSEKRDPDWLKRWMAAPDVMLAEKDPIALQLMEQYSVKMPNFNLSDYDIGVLIEYIDEESSRLRRVAERKQQQEKVLPSISG